MKNNKFNHYYFHVEYCNKAAVNGYCHVLYKYFQVLTYDLVDARHK